MQRLYYKVEYIGIYIDLHIRLWYYFPDSEPTEMSRRASVVLLLLIWTSFVRGDFPCLCCYSLETTVYRAKALTAGTLGKAMYRIWYTYVNSCWTRLVLVTKTNVWIGHGCLSHIQSNISLIFKTNNEHRQTITFCGNFYKILCTI